MRNLAGKSALVTGGRQGIGRGIVDRFVAEGARVMTCGRGERPADLPENVLWSTTDVSDPAQVAALTDRVVEAFGLLDVLVNNAGVQIEKTVVETSDADWERLMGVNARGVFLACRDLIPVMSEGGSIINIGSISASNADPGLALYNASKAFVQGLTRSIAVDHGPAIRCNAIAPGWIMTDMADAAFAVAADPALATWLASDDAAFATGQVYTLDGGLTAASPLNPALF